MPSLVVVALLALSPGRARAEEAAILVGPFAAFGRHATAPASAGVEGTLDFSVDGFCRFGIPCELLVYGPIAQAEYLGDHARFLAGVQGGSLVGLELGAAIETAGRSNAATASVHVAPYFSIGLVSVAVRIGAPVARLSSGERFGSEVGAVLALKAPIFLR